MNPDKFYQRTKLFNDILHEIFNVESNYRTELSVLNLKLLRKIEEHKNKIIQKSQIKTLKKTPSSKAIKLPETRNLKLAQSLTSRNTKDNIAFQNEENSILDKLISEGLQNILTFYKTKHKLISKEVSNLGIVIYRFSSSRKKYSNNDDFNILEDLQKNFELNFSKLMGAKKKYFEKMNNLELFFQDQENNKILNGQKKNNNTNINNEKEQNKIIEELKEKEIIDELIILREKYKKYLARLTHYQKTYIAKINEIGNDIQEFNITENTILNNIFRIFEQKLINLLQEVKNFSQFYEHNKNVIQNLNIELKNNLMSDIRLQINYKFEEYTPKFADIKNQKDLKVIQKMNKLIGFEFDKIKTNNKNNSGLNDKILYDKDIDDNLLFILLMDKFVGDKNILNEEEKNLMQNLFNQEKYINEFLNKLNKIRINKQIFNTKEKFEVLVYFFNIIFSKISFSNKKFHELVKFLLILTETFFYKEGDKKVFLNSVITMPKELKDGKFWIQYIEFEIENEYKKYENKKNTRFEYIVLLSNTTHLTEFLIEKEIIREIIEYFKDKYKYSLEEIDIIKEQLKL